MYYIIWLVVCIQSIMICQGEIDVSTLFVTKVAVTYNEALQTCQSRGMKLVKITSSDDNAVVNGFANTMLINAFWIDGNDNTNEGTWVDSKGQELAYKNFGPGNPDGGRNENCINIFRLPSGHWNDYYCGYRIFAICQKYIENEITTDQIDIEGNRMIVSNKKLSFADSQDYCSNRGMKMVRISHSVDNAEVHSFARETTLDMYWLDANDISVEGNWVDSDGNPLIYKNFNRGEPAGGRVENCAHGYLYADGVWNDYSCDYPLWAICYKEKRKYRTTDTNMIIASHDRLTFNEAQEYCKSLDLQMLKANNAAENALIHGFARRIGADLYWLDGNDAKLEGRWVDMDNNDLIHKGFYPGEPNGGTTENCLNGYLNLDGLWNDITCTYKNIFAFCYIGAFTLDNTEYEINRKNLMVSTDRYTYNEAIQFCRTRGTQLIKINDAKDNALVAEFAKKVVANYYWIDGNDQTEEGRWVDSNGKLLSFKNFANNEPNGGRGENCLISYYMEEGTWRDIGCSNKYLAICSKKTYMN